MFALHSRRREYEKQEKYFYDSFIAHFFRLLTPISSLTLSFLFDTFYLWWRTNIFVFSATRQILPVPFLGVLFVLAIWRSLRKDWKFIWRFLLLFRWFLSVTTRRNRLKMNFYGAQVKIKKIFIHNLNNSINLRWKTANIDEIKYQYFSGNDPTARWYRTSRSLRRNLC